MGWSRVGFSSILNLTFEKIHYLFWEIFYLVEVFSSIPQTLSDIPRGTELALVGTTGMEFENWENPDRMQLTPIPFCNVSFEKIITFYKPPVSMGNHTYTSASLQNGLL